VPTSKSQLELVLQAVNKASGPLAEVKAAIAGLGPQAKQASSAVAKVGDASAISRFGEAAKGAYGHVAALVGKITDLSRGLYGAVKATAAEGGALAKASDGAGLAVDTFAQLRFASGLDHDSFTQGITTFVRSIGQAKAGFGKGPLQGLLEEANPAFLAQLKRAKGTEAALNLMISAYEKLTDAGKKQALAQAAFGGAGGKFVGFLSKGELGITNLRNSYARIAGPQELFARSSGAVNFALKRQELAMDAAKKTALVALYPAITQIAGAVEDFFVDKRPAIARWAADFGSKLPARVERFVGTLTGLWQAGERFVGALGGWRDVLLGVAAIIGTKVVLAIYAIGAALVANPVGLIVTGIALGAVLIVKYWTPIKGFFSGVWASIQSPVMAVWDWLKATILAPVGGLIASAWDSLKSYFPALWSGVKAVFSAWWTTVKTLFSWSPLGLVIANWTPVKEFMVGLWVVLREPVAGLLSLVREVFNWTPLGLVIKNWEPIKGFFKGLWEGITRIFDEAWAKVKPIVDKISGAAGLLGKLPGLGLIQRVREIGRKEIEGGAAAPAGLGPSLGPPRAVGASSSQPPPKKGELKVKVDFSEIPPGVKVSSIASGLDDDVEIDRGYSSALPL
jgi:hypothetical protein